MPFDALALHAVADELRSTLLTGRVQRLHLPDEQSLALEIYAHGQRQWLLASVAPEAARVHLVAAPPPHTAERVPPFLLLARKHVRDSRLLAVDQPPLERVLALRFAHREPTGLRREVTLICEIMGRRSNLVLVDEDGTILDALKRVSQQLNPTRPILPHTRYAPPPPLDRPDPRRADAYVALRDAAAQDDPRTLAALLVARLAGLSPRAAEEIAFRATGQHDARLSTLRPAGDDPVASLHHAAAELLAPIDTHVWEPHLIARASVPFDATPYRPRQFAVTMLEAVPTMSAALERLHAPRRLEPEGGTLAQAGHRPHATPRAPLVAALGQQREKLEHKLAALERSLDAAARADELRAAGEAVLAALHAIEPGQRSLASDGRDVPLDPERTALENAQDYFDEYRRARDAARVVPPLVEETRLALRYVEEMAAQVQLADDATTLEQLRRELVAQDWLAPNRGESKRGRPAAPRGALHRARLAGFEVLVGTSALGNERVTFELAMPDDLWMHARGVPGSHVVLRSGGRFVPAAAIEAAAQLAAERSAARADALVSVDWTPRKYVRKIRGGPPGLVTYAREQTLRVRPNGDRAE